MTIKNYTIILSKVEYLFVTPSETEAGKFDLHLHFESGGYARINALSEDDISPIRAALLSSEGEGGPDEQHTS
jgi:hypothetical protein